MSVKGEEVRHNSRICLESDGRWCGAASSGSFRRQGARTGKGKEGALRGMSLNQRFKSTAGIAWETFKGWRGDRCDGLGASLAFFALLALPSFFVLFLMLGEAVWG